MRVHGSVEPPEAILAKLNSCVANVTALIADVLASRKNKPLLSEGEWAVANKSYLPVINKVLKKVNDWLQYTIPEGMYEDNLKATALSVVDSVVTDLLERAKEESDVPSEEAEKKFFTTTTFADILNAVQRVPASLTTPEYKHNFKELLDALDAGSENAIFDSLKRLNIPREELVYSRYRFLSDNHSGILKIGKQLAHSRRLFDKGVVHFDTLQDFELAIKDQSVPVIHDMLVAWIRYEKHRDRIIRNNNERVVTIHGVPMALAAQQHTLPELVDIEKSALIPITTVAVRQYTKSHDKNKSFSEKIKELTRTSTRPHVMELLLDESYSGDSKNSKVYKTKDISALAVLQTIMGALRKTKALNEFDGNFRVFGVVYYGIARLVQNMRMPCEDMRKLSDSVGERLNQYSEQLVLGASLGIIFFIEKEDGSVIKVITQIVDYASAVTRSLSTIENIPAYAAKVVSNRRPFIFRQALAAPHNFYAFVPSEILIIYRPTLLL